VQGFPVLMLVLLAIACYAMSLAPITWVIISEIFPNRIRGAAMAVAVFGQWVANWVVTVTFPPVVAGFGPAGAYAVYCVFAVGSFAFVARRVRETRGMALEEM
jgi:MFS family permease